MAQYPTADKQTVAPPGELSPKEQKRHERRAFVFLAVFLAPALAVAVVGGYGFIIWMSHLLVGPPTS